MIKNYLSHPLRVNGYVSLNPTGTMAKFPAYLGEAGINHLDLRVIGSLDYKMALLGCHTQLISFSHPDVLQPPPL